MAPSGQGQDMKPELEAEVGTEMGFELTYASSMYCCYYYSVSMYTYVLFVCCFCWCNCCFFIITCNGGYTVSACVCVRVCSLALLLSTHNGNLINIHKHTNTHIQTRAPGGRMWPSGAAGAEGDFVLNLQSDWRFTGLWVRPCNRYFN